MSQQESGPPKDRPTVIIETVLGNRKVLKALLSEGELREKLLDQASLAISGLSVRDTGVFFDSLMTGLSRDDDEWDLDRRDGALELLQLIDFERIKEEHLLQTYVAAVTSQDADSDPSGSIYSLFAAGKELAFYFPMGEETRETVRSSWQHVANLHGPGRGYIQEESRRLVAKIPRQPEDLLGEADVRLGGRKQPDFEEAESVLHNNYLEVTKAQKTFKLSLWENTPQFRALCKEWGVDLERFWNITNPDLVVNGLQTIDQEKFPQAYAQLNKALRAEIGVGISDLAEDQIRVVSDEVTRAAAKAKSAILSTVRDFNTVVNNFRSLITDAKSKGPRAQKAAASQVANFFGEYRIHLNTLDLQTVESTLNNKDHIADAKKQFDQRQQTNQHAAAVLEEAFDLENQPKGYLLISRQQEDLFLGDLTGDCTAYHLYTGFNAWTVPIWLSNPGFNFFKIMDGEKMVAKMGMVLAIADQVEPALVVDSFEVAKDITDETRARGQINDGLQSLQKWAKGIGVPTVFLNTSSNSDGAGEIFWENAVQSSRFRLDALGGLSGVSEVRQRLGGNKTKERIYLQTRGWGDLEDEEEETLQQRRLIREFEEIVTQTITSAPSDEVRSTIVNTARAENWEELFGHILDIKYPFVSQKLGNEWNNYKKYMDALEVDEVGNVQIAESYDPFYPMALPIQSIMQEKIIEDAVMEGKIPEEDQEEERQLWEAGEVDNLLTLVKQLERFRIPPELVLKRLFGQLYAEGEVDTEDEMALRLNHRIPILSHN